MLDNLIDFQRADAGCGRLESLTGAAAAVTGARTGQPAWRLRAVSGQLSVTVQSASGQPHKSPRCGQ